MKKQILLLIMTMFFVTSSFAQVRTISSKLRVKKHPDAVATDTLIAINADGIYAKTDIAIGDIGGGGSLTNIYNADGVILTNVVRTVTLSSGSTLFIGGNGTTYSFTQDQMFLSAPTMSIATPGDEASIQVDEGLETDNCRLMLVEIISTYKDKEAPK